MISYQTPPNRILWASFVTMQRKTLGWLNVWISSRADSFGAPNLRSRGRAGGFTTPPPPFPTPPRRFYSYLRFDSLPQQSVVCLFMVLWRRPGVPVDLKRPQRASNSVCPSVFSSVESPCPCGSCSSILSNSANRHGGRSRYRQVPGSDPIKK